MGQHKHNPTAIAAKNGELPPKKRERRLTKRQAERLLKAEILSRCTPLLALLYEMQNRKNYVYPYRCLKHKAERFSEKDLEHMCFSGEECKDYEDMDRRQT